MIFALFVIWFLAYWLGMAGVIGLDGRRQREKARAAGTVDFQDRSPLPFMMMGALCGPIPLVLYFGTTRKSARGWVLGLAIGVGWSLAFGMLFNLIAALARAGYN